MNVGHPTLNGECLDRDAKSLALLAEMTGWVERGEPFCHLRFGDGEFDSMDGIDRTNSDGAHLHPETLGVELLRVLKEVADGHCFSDAIRIGGIWSYRHEDLIDANFLRHSVPWCSANAFYEGIAGLQTLDFILRLRESPRRKILVGSDRIWQASQFLGAATQIHVPLASAWEHRELLLDGCKNLAGNDATFIFCAGPSSCVWGWEIWKQCPQSQIIDFGHIFDSCLGFATRRYMGATGKLADKERRIKKAIRLHYSPMFR